MSVLSYYCTNLGTHERLSCEKKFGGFSAFAFVDGDAGITDYTNATQWNNAITNGDVTLFKGIKGMFPEPSAIEGEAMIACGRENEVDSYNRTFTWKDFNVSQSNNDLYDALKTRKGYLVAYNCAEDEIWVVDSYPVDFNVRLLGMELTTQKNYYAGTASWVGLKEPQILTAPAGVFD